MSEFPTLKTGAVMQYPAQRTLAFSTYVLRFVDGSEQRCRLHSAPLRRWVVRLNLLDEAELGQLENFFNANQGGRQDFAFTDPQDGAHYPSCSIEADEEIAEHTGPDRARTQIVIRENRS